jgi:ubiquinone biosynthesis protein COQ4
VARGSKPTWGFRLAVRQWPSLAKQVRETPDDVALGARVFFAMGGYDEGGAYRRFRETEEGRRLLETQGDYSALFTDYDRLRALPAGTLGWQYVRELDERGIHPVEINRATEPAYEGIEFSPGHRYVRDRVRNAHDLIHTLTGYGIDMNGEAGVAAFTLAQTRNKGWGMLVLINLGTALSAGRVDGARVAWKAYRRGRRARFVPGVADWERLLQLPIDEARAELGITPLEPYRALHLEEMFPNAPKGAG